ncbi:uncharacterized protein LOC114515970 [Dendronephthya gigantea]|uniref:uncharacterized protein LOC114515970 n=1 Tax=Dendronephthya gigantea TaxID=151771 RepID=UPI001069882A|nr:uncharacterized protein LOC114515970 [Dendronephthya gigantea]
MAEYITANRWITGVATHKTKSGRILCTGFGCIGCFPQDFPEIACELEVYDSKTGLLFAESWTNEFRSVNSESVMETGKQRNRKIKPTKQRRCSTNSQNDDSDTENVDGIENENVQDWKFRKLFITECEQEDTQSKTSVETEAHIPHQEKLPCITENSKEYSLPSGTQNLAKQISFHVEREDCVCLFFDSEYNHGSRRLSKFGILEIVNSLTSIMHLNEIKCVQRLNGLWHIVLRTREHLPCLLKNGLEIRCRSFKVVQDNTKYCEKVY